MKILMLSEDPKIMDSHSQARQRMKEYTAVLGELHIIVLAKAIWDTREQPLFLYAVKNGFFRAVHMYIRARILCRAHSFDAVTVQGADDIGIIGFLIAWTYRVPFQLQVHTDILNPWYRTSSWKEYIKYRIARYLMRRADMIRVVSERIKNSLVSEAGIASEKITVLPVFTDLQYFADARRDTAVDARFAAYDFKMIAAGRFVEKEKNFLLLIEMMKKFVAVCPDALLVLVGEGPAREQYVSKITAYGLEKNVLLEPWRSDLPSFFKSFDLFLLSSNYEGWGRSVLEAMMAGLPVVMTDVGLAGEIVKDNRNGRVVPVGDVDAMLHAVQGLWRMPEKRRMFAETAVDTVRDSALLDERAYLEAYRASFLNMKKSH